MGLSACIAVQSADDYSCIQVNEGLGDFEGGGDQKLLYTPMLLPLVLLDMDQLTGIKSVFFKKKALLILDLNYIKPCSFLAEKIAQLLPLTSHKHS